MEYYRTLDLTLVSVNGLKNARKSNVYAVASIYDSSEVQKFKTPVHKDPEWNFPMKFTVNETVALKKDVTLVVKIKGVRMFVDKCLAKVRVPIKELLERVKTEGKMVQNVSYTVRGRDGESKGVVSFSYKFGEKMVRSKAVYRPRVVRGTGGYSSSSGMGFGTGFVGGMLISDIANNAGGGGGGGGCGGGGGGCGGGCGGGGGGCGGGGGGCGGCS